MHSLESVLGDSLRESRTGSTFKLKDENGLLEFITLSAPRK
jgi:hypothetical protein